MQSTYNAPPFRRSSQPRRPSLHRLAAAWAKIIRDEVASEHRSLETHDPSSPRIRPTLATSVGFVVLR